MNLKERFLKDIQDIVGVFESKTGVSVKAISFERELVKSTNALYPSYILSQIKLEMN